jgi:hypothetical protein
MIENAPKVLDYGTCNAYFSGSGLRLRQRINQPDSWNVNLEMVLMCGLILLSDLPLQ